MCEELPHVLTALMTRETDQENSRIAMSELRYLFSDNEVDRLRMQRVRAHQTQQQRHDIMKLSESADAALKYTGESTGLCCAGGKVKLPQLVPPPDPLRSLVSGIGNDSKHFLANIQKYNNCFQMTSFGYTYYARQFHAHFQDAEVDNRCAHNPTVKRTIVQELQMFLHQNNNLVNMFKIALDRMPSDSHNIIIRADKTPAGEHTRRFNSPTIDEVAVVIVGENLQSRDIVLHRRNSDLKRVSETHRSYDGLQYPLIFWQGRWIPF
ncbi:hypothetical protein EVAR_28640_1 [Eumeta japonica]|uniref:Helitron helicase-like domain-containing protein n=1 Tax=Eumeta variegata TaxID=151549 RepID=A0A4C1ZJ35_EUMVA|nr:hypothetical protein EVAR_28640_1 [Eumeta japonica]